MEGGEGFYWVNKSGLRGLGAERGGSRGVDGWVGVARHVLSMVGAEGVSAEGGVGVLVLKGL
jgi:hypothetical protein